MTDDAAMAELIRQANSHATRLENGASQIPGACPAHADLCRGVALSLRMLVVHANRAQTPKDWNEAAKEIAVKSPFAAAIVIGVTLLRGQLGALVEMIARLQ